MSGMTDRTLFLFDFIANSVCRVVNHIIAHTVHSVVQMCKARWTREGVCLKLIWGREW